MEKQGRERQEDWELKEVEVKTRGLGDKGSGSKDKRIGSKDKRNRKKDKRNGSKGKKSDEHNKEIFTVSQRTFSTPTHFPFSSCGSLEPFP